MPIQSLDFKICESTKHIEGCGRRLPVWKFQKTANGGSMKICSDCLLNYRDKHLTVRRKHATSDETKLFSEFDKLMNSKPA